MGMLRMTNVSFGAGFALEFRQFITSLGTEERLPSALVRIHATYFVTYLTLIFLTSDGILYLFVLENVSINGLAYK